MCKKGFTLIEIIVVVAILGIVGAIVLPMIGNHVSHGKEASARKALQMIRSQSELYRFEHQGLAPGYFLNPLGIKSQATATMLVNQFIGTSTIDGNAVVTRTPAGLYRLWTLS